MNKRLRKGAVWHGPQRAWLPLLAAIASALPRVPCEHTWAQDAASDAWDRALKKHVTTGLREGIHTNVVDYCGFRNDPDFHTFVQSLETTNLAVMGRNETQALLMNAYNALAIKMVIDHPCLSNGRPISSIRDISGGTRGSVWKKTAGNIGGSLYSLDDIETTLRNPTHNAGDPRLHSCIVCASISCPNLRREAFRSSTIDMQMDAQMRDMLSNTEKGLALDDGTVKLSNIFNWYAKDFKSVSSSVLDFLLPFMPTADKGFNSSDVQISYFDYDWNLNGDASCNCNNSLLRGL
jgi:hypothetical protein